MYPIYNRFEVGTTCIMLITLFICNSKTPGYSTGLCSSILSYPTNSGMAQLTMNPKPFQIHVHVFVASAYNV